MKRSRIVLADKHPNTLGAIRYLLESEAESVLMVADEASLWDALENFRPDVKDYFESFLSGNPKNFRERRVSK